MMDPEYIHTKPRGTHRAHIFEWTEKGTTGGYTEDAQEAVCGGTQSYGRFYIGLPDEDEDVCGNCRRVIKAREEGKDAVSAHEGEEGE